MLQEEQLLQTVQRLAHAATQPATVIVFGSYGRGEATEASDLDRVVIEPGLQNKAAEYLRLRATIGRMDIGVDLLLFAQADFDRRSQVPGTLPYRACKEGKVLHDPSA